MSRRVVLATFASLLARPKLLLAQDAAAQMVAVEGEGAGYWSRWRGPSGQGIVAGNRYPDAWSGTQNVLWRTPIPGRGNSSPIVWRDRIVLTTAYDGGRRLSVLAIRRTDGMRLWETYAPWYTVRFC